MELYSFFFRFSRQEHQIYKKNVANTPFYEEKLLFYSLFIAPQLAENFIF